MKKTFLTLIAFISGFVLFAQDNTPVQKKYLNNINLNFLGNASLISINYERLYIFNERFFIAGQIGGGYNEQGGWLRCMLGCDSPPERYLTIPLHITGNFGKGRNLFELGVGSTGINGKETQNYYLFPIIGYRLQPHYVDERLNLRAFVSVPFNMMDTNKIIFIPIGLSLGYGF